MSAEKKRVIRPGISEATSEANGVLPRQTPQGANNDLNTRIARYLGAMPPAIAGQQGRKATFRVAITLTQGFGLEPQAALPFMLAYNMSCVPPWVEYEVGRMLEAAAKLPPRQPRGYLLTNTRPRTAVRPTAPSFKPLPLTQQLLAETAAARPYSVDGLAFAALNGFLVFTKWLNSMCYGVTDSTGKLVELRRIDNRPFPAVGTLSQRKSHALRGSNKRWPLGASEIGDRPLVLLTEGIPDFLAAHQLVAEGAAGERMALVCMLSASPRIAEDALPYFVGKTVRIVPHIDQAGVEGAQKWQAQLVAAGATVEFFDLSCHDNIGNSKDLYDFERASLGKPERKEVTV